MELDSFLASPRWDILRIISENPYSPIEIAERTKTTVSFVSQQLKLLEAAGLVKKENQEPSFLFQKTIFILLSLQMGLQKRN